MASRDKYVEKVRKILAKAEGASTEAEADAFFSKAAELMAEWEIHESELKETERTSVVTVHWRLGTYTPTADAAAIGGVAGVFGIESGYVAYRGRGTHPEVVLIGRQGDVERFELLWTSVHLQMITAMKTAEWTHAADRSALRRFRQSFKLGFVYRVADRLKAERNQMANTGMALELVKTDVREEADRQFAPGRTSDLQLDSGAMAAGHRAGGQADLGGARIQNTKSKELT